MNELRKIRSADTQSHVRRVLIPALCLLAILILGLAIQTQLSVGVRAKPAEGDLHSADRFATNTPNASRVTPIGQEIPADQEACILTASATDVIDPAVVEA